MLPSERLVVYAEKELAPVGAKTVAGILRYRADDVVAVIDSTKVGQDPAACVGIRLDRKIPVVASVRESLKFQPDTLLIGMHPALAIFPKEWRRAVMEAIEADLSIINGLHYLLADDAEIAALANDRKVQIWDVRRPPCEDLLPRYESHRPGARVVLTVGSDTSVGKMTTALELHREMASRGENSVFVATGQIGLMIGHYGVPADHILSDFVTGHVERCVLAAAQTHDWVFVEGQGALNNPAVSPVTLGLIHGALPNAMILSHRAGQQTLKKYPQCQIPPLRALVEMNETAANWLHPEKASRVLGVSLDTSGLDEDAARRAVKAAESGAGLPATDVIRDGAGRLANALQNAL